MKRTVFIALVFVILSASAFGDSLNVAFVGRCEIPDSPYLSWDVTVSDSYAYVTCHSGLTVIDVSDPALPELVCVVETPYYPGDVDVEGAYAYVLSWTWISVLDISDPTSPDIVGECYVPSNHGYSIRVSGSVAYGVGQHGLNAIDISNPFTPDTLGFIYTESSVDLDVSGEHAFVAEDDSGLAVIDVSMPDSMVIVGRYAPSDSLVFFNRVKVKDSLAHVIDLGFGLRILDVSDPAEPILIGQYELEGGAVDIFVSSSYAYVTIDSFGLRVLDISDPTQPQEVGFFEVDGRVDYLYVQEPYIYVTRQHEYLDIYKNLLITDVRESLTVEYPVKIHTALNRLAYDVPGKALLAVYSADGRKVAEETIEGVGVWTAQDITPGVYFARVENISRCATARFIVLR